MASLPIVPLKGYLTARAGITAVAKLLKSQAQVPQVLDPKFPILGGFPDSAIAITYICLLAQGQTAFDGVDAMRRDPTFATALGLPSLPSAPTVRQRIEARGQEWLPHLNDANMRLLKRSSVKPTALENGYIPLDLDVFTMNNDDSKKEGIGYTYAGCVGYAPIAAYLGREGYLLELGLRPGTQHSALETHYVLERVLPNACILTHQPLLLRMDSGFDSKQIYTTLQDADKARLASHTQAGIAASKIDYIIKWNPRAKDREAIHAGRIVSNAVFDEVRPGLSCTTWKEAVDGHFRVLKLTVETINKNGQHNLIPKLSVEGWNTSLNAQTEQEIMALYADHGTHEQFHAELKSELNLERLPSGKFDANDTVCSLAMLAYNVLRIIGQQALIGEDSPVKHHAERRRIKTVIREFICAPGQWIKSGRTLSLGIPVMWAGFRAFAAFLCGPLFVNTVKVQSSAAS